MGLFCKCAVDAEALSESVAVRVVQILRSEAQRSKNAKSKVPRVSRSTKK